MRRVVITGIGAVSPNGLGREAFWQATRAGISGVRDITGIAGEASPARIAGHAADFDPRTVMDDHDLANVGRVAPLALAAAGEALADAGLEPEKFSLAERRNFAVSLGTGGGALAFVEQQFATYFGGHEKRCSVYTIPSATPGSLASEVSMRFGLHGYSHLLSTGCTSSTDALGHARRTIATGEAERVLAGGADAPLAPLIIKAFCMMKILTPAWNHAPTRASRPFCAGRDGFVLGEGAWLFVLEEREQARARGARIYAEITGYGSTCEAFHRVRLEESGEEPARAMQIALTQAGVLPEELDYVNLHGTATQLNDRIETRALKLALGKAAVRVPGSALKSLIGHPQGASGAAGVAATLLAMRDGWLPPTINLDHPDPECDLDYVPHQGRARAIGHALCNCIGFGSKNSALVLSRAESS